MSKRKLSGDDKREKLLELFHETSDVFQLKDLERIAPREKKIVPQSIRPILQELVESGHVRTDMIAGSVFYWAFPSEALAEVKRQLRQTENECSDLDDEIDLAEEDLAEAERTPEELNLVEKMVEDIGFLKVEKADLEEKIKETVSEEDYIATESKAKENQEILQAVNRWTDNIFCIKSFCIRKFSKQDAEIDRAFNIPEDLDYIFK